MTQIEKTKSKLEKIFDQGHDQNERELPNELRVVSLFLYSKQFLSAAEIIDREAPNLFLQYLHLWGQAIELALKGYILSCNQEPKEIHDLVKLTIKAESLGLVLEQIENSSVVLLNHYFFEDLASKTKFKTRYPTRSDESVGGPIPEKNVLLGLFNSLVLQSNPNCQIIDLTEYV